MENVATPEVVYMNSQWLSDVPTVGAVETGTTVNSATLRYYGDTTNGWNTYYTPTYWWPYQTEKKIRLTLTEVEHLRALCRSDKRLRATMQKVAPHIEVEVDFPGGGK